MVPIIFRLFPYPPPIFSTRLTLFFLPKFQESKFPSNEDLKQNLMQLLRPHFCYCFTKVYHDGHLKHHGTHITFYMMCQIHGLGMLGSKTVSNILDRQSSYRDAAHSKIFIVKLLPNKEQKSTSIIRFCFDKNNSYLMVK